MPSRPLPDYESGRSVRSSATRAVTLLLATFVVLGLLGQFPAAADEPVPPAGPRILIIRGVFNVFSTGLDDLGQKLRERGYDVEVSSPGGCWAGALRLREAYERDPRGGPLVIIGHSMGGRACLHISRYLEAYNIPVKLVVVIDANAWVTCPENVDRCVNLYVTNSYGVFHGSPVRGESAARVLNYDVTKVERPAWADPVDHFNIDNSPWMHGVIVGEIDRAYAPWRTSRTAPRWDASAAHAVARPEAAGTQRGPAGDAAGRATPAGFSSPGHGHAVFPATSGERSPGVVPPARPQTEATPPQPLRPPWAIHFRL